MSKSAKLADWEKFVIANGWQAQAYELAAVVGQPVDAIQRLRATGACSRLEKAKDFAELFALWHGREPGERRARRSRPTPKSQPNGEFTR